ncbi:hypothetical protein EW145_g3058 [Phellinidium pouzarii]|uniref:Glutathione S-transferase UstS-like C-terminal domain-containing protein n=1 Tax=Phellinidium pouzarii TaxID=167371 RepID=A0A4S4L8Z8_9AGAM|nr:hypothetical protein EW145_g3058 [Phellinidium pouzarii]
MSQPYITLYDTPSSQSNGWAPSIWRIRYDWISRILTLANTDYKLLLRLILNYKRLPYKTSWVEFPELDRTMRSIGAPVTSTRSDGRSVYTLPVIVDPLRSPSAPVVLSNPSIISEYLEINYPARPLFPDGSKALQTLFVHYLHEVFSKPLLPIMIPLSAQKLPERSQAHFFAHGQKLHEPYPSGPQREQAWIAIRDNFNFLASVLDKNSGDDGDSVLVSGKELTYADFALCSIMIWIERLSPQEGWPRIKTWNGGRWSRLMERCRAFMDVM